MPHPAVTTTIKEPIMNKALLAILCASSLLAPLAANAGEVRNREGRQENRIYQGVRSGQVTPHEYDHLQSQEGRLNDQRANDLRRDDGHLTGSQYRQLNHEENHLSREIYRDKHNDRTDPGVPPA
jgi:hypothetical protein